MNRGILNPPSFSKLIARVEFGDPPQWQLSRTNKANIPIPVIYSPAYLSGLFLRRTCYLCTYCIYAKFFMGWMIVGSNPRGGNSSALLHASSDWPLGEPTLWNNGYCGFFLRVKWPKCGTEHPPPTSAEFEWVEHKGIPLTTSPSTSPCQ
jgi:hypothetical protein